MGNTKRKLTIARQFFGYLLDGMISVYLMLVIVVMPFYNEMGYGHIGTDKAMFFRKISVYAVTGIVPVMVILLILWISEKGHPAKAWRDFWEKSSVTDRFALVYGVSVILSYLCSNYKENALWGARGWYMGFVPQMFLIAIYFMVSRLWKPKKWLFLLFLPSSAAVFLLGYLNRFGIYPIDMRSANPEFISTIGNINWYCGYLVSIFFAGCYLLWQSGDRRTEQSKCFAVIQHILLSAYAVLGFATLVTQGSRSGLLALTVVMLVMFCFSVEDGKKMQMFWYLTLILSLTCTVTLGIRVMFPERMTYTDTFVDFLTYTAFPVFAVLVSSVFLAVTSHYNANGKYQKSSLKKLYEKLTKGLKIGSAAVIILVIGMIVLNTIRPGSLGKLSEVSFFTFNADWASSRGATWMAGWRCFQEQNFLHKLVGVGPDCMGTFLYQEGSAELVEMVRAKFGMLPLTNAHGEWLNILVNIGLFGCAGFVGMMVSAVLRFLRCGMAHADANGAIVGACGLCLLAYTVNNLFSFQQSMNAATIFVILGIGESYMHKRSE